MTPAAKAAETRKRNAEKKSRESAARIREMKKRFADRVAAADPSDPLTDDHHWNPEHPNFDPDCYCGTPGWTGKKPTPTNTVDVPDPIERPLPSRGNGSSNGPTEKQVGYLESLKAKIEAAADRLGPDAQTLIEIAIEALASNDRQKVSEAIELLKPAAAPKRRNRYGGDCHKCGAYIEAEAGLLVKPNGRWGVEHDGPCPEKTETAPAPAAPVVDSEKLSKLPKSGYYMIDGNRYRLDAPKSGKWTGFLFLKTGSDYHEQKRLGTYGPTGDWRGSENGRTVVEAILADPKEAAAEYGRNTGTCGRCHAKLEDEDSRKLGLGPVCRSKF